jgi:signal transduction histidine kinase
MDRAAGEALELIDGLVEVGRLEAPGEVLHRRPVKLSELVQDVADGLAATAAAKGMKLEVAASEEEAVVDVARCSVAIRNLVANAIKYAPAGSRVRIKAELDEGVASIEVADEGPGIPKAECERIFERYYRLERTRQARQSGSGLGLYIVKRIAELHGGSADVVAGPGGGATFRLRLAAA